MTEELWQKYSHTDDREAKDALVREYLPMVKQLAGRLSLGLPPHVEEDELVASGLIGLLEALERYDPSFDAGFKTFAYWRIRGAMLDELRKITWLPRSLYQRLRRLQAAEQEMAHRLGREPTQQEVAEELKWPVETVVQVYAQVNCSALVSLEALLFAPSSSALLSEQGEELLGAGGTFPTPEESLEKRERREILARALEELSEREKLVLALYYKEELTLREIGRILKVSTARVSQIHARTIANLREKLQKTGYLEK